jgi:DNA-binding NarL/FixJ family response regulator
MVQVLIADELLIVRRGVRQIVETQPFWSVCGEAGDGLQAIELAKQMRPDVVVLDVALPVQNGLMVASRLKRLVPNIELLLFTDQDDERTISLGLGAGARGCLMKSDSAAYLVAAIKALAMHRSFFSPVVSDLLLGATVIKPAKIEVASFTGRELDVIQFVTAGVRNAVIAERLGISLKTVESHRASAMRKAGTHSASGLTRFAIQNRLVQP